MSEENFNILLDEQRELKEFMKGKFETEEEGRKWLYTNNPFLNNKKPIGLYSSIVGIHELKAILKGH